MIEFFTYVRLMAMAMRREVAPLASILICDLRSLGMYSSAISGMMVMLDVVEAFGFGVFHNEVDDFLDICRVGSNISILMSAQR